MENKPTHLAYSVRNFSTEEGKEEASWSRVGAAWAHKDGKGFNLTLDALPVSGRVVLRVNDGKKSGGPGESA